LEKKEWQYACRLFRTNCLKEGAVARQWPTNNNRGIVFSMWSMPRCYEQDELVVSLEELDAKMN
jgi:hypothetical protein